MQPHGVAYSSRAIYWLYKCNILPSWWVDSESTPPPEQLLQPAAPQALSSTELFIWIYTEATPSHHQKTKGDVKSILGSTSKPQPSSISDAFT